jgi:hypothetical protein
MDWSIGITQTATLATSALDMDIRNDDAWSGDVIHSGHGVGPRLTRWASTDRPGTPARPAA